MKRILITGGAGYIGSVLTRKLLALDYQVTILDNFMITEAGLKDLWGHPRLRIIKADIRDVASLKESLAGVEFVIHLAAIANDPSAALDLQLTRQVNLESYPFLLDQAVEAGVKRFINLSSIGVYGINFSNNVTEEDPINPLTEYASCKAKAKSW